MMRRHTSSTARARGDRLPRCWYTQYDASPATMRPCHHEVASIFRFQSSEAFQSSRMSWSSKIMALGSVRQEPSIRLVRPRELVEVRVLLVVLELLPRLLVDVAPAADEVLHLLRGRVRVHLVAEEEEQVGTVGPAVGDGEGEGAQRVDAVRAIPVPVVGARSCGTTRRRSAPAARACASRSPAAGTRSPPRARRAGRRPAPRRVAPCRAPGRRPRRGRSGGRERRSVRACHDRPSALTVTRQSARVSTQMLADVSSTNRSIGPSTSGEAAMHPVLPRRVAQCHGLHGGCREPPPAASVPPARPSDRAYPFVDPASRPRTK